MKRILLLFLSLSFLSTIQLIAQCTGGSDEGVLSPVPSSSVNTIAIKGGRYYTFTATAGQIFLFSTHPDDGGLTAFDTKITILDNSGNALAFDDDYCDRSSRLVWTATSSGTFRVLMMRFNCVGTGTPSTMAYQILNTYTPIDNNCGISACENDEYALLSNMPTDFFDYVSSGGEPDANGMIGTNQSGWQGAEFQRGGVRRMLGGLIHNDTDMMEDAWQTIRVTFEQQQADGGFGDNSSDAAFWLHECSHSLLLLKESPYLATYQDSLTKYLPFIQNALAYITNPVELDLLFNQYDKQAANRLFIDANAIALTGLLIDDTTTYLPISRTFIAQGLEIMKDSIFCEKGGYDTSYQGTSIFELNYYTLRFPYPNLDCILRKNTIWEANRVNNLGFVDTVGNTRTGSCQEVYNGVCKEINYEEVARGLYYYGYRFCDFTNGIAPAIRVYRFDKNNQSYNPTVNCSSNCNNVLPIELTDFNTTCLANGSVELNWKTISEQNNSHFEIEYSNDGFDFNKIGQLKGKGTTIEAQNYHFLNTLHDFSKQGFYRLKQVDFDGKFTYSNIITINCEQTKLASDFQIYPNPVEETLKLHFFSNTHTFEVQIYNVLGNFIKAQSIENTRITAINVSDLQSGIYFIKTGNTTKRFIKK